jgi:hypothetical protein
MKRITAISIALILVLSVFFITGCGGKSQKINGVADEESQVMDEAKQGEKESLPATYTAEAGDTLWSIAEKAEIYGNAQQWPIIYDNNRDILDDYKKPLEEGTKLIIPRNISAVEIEAAKEKASEYGMPPGQGSKRVSSEDEESSEDAQNNVAGMGESGAGGDDASASEGSSDSAGSDSEEASGEPTPIPEPVKAKKKGGNNMMMLLLALLGVIAVVIFFIISKQKKKEEEDEKGEGETKTNILD